MSYTSPVYDVGLRVEAGASRVEGSLVEPREPVRRARFFRGRERDPAVSESINLTLQSGAATGELMCTFVYALLRLFFIKPM